MLARDPIEVTEAARAYLKTQPLCDFYQEILLGGLKLAQLDAARGTLDDEGRANIRDAVEEVVDDLRDHVDRPPAAHDRTAAARDKTDEETPLAHLSKAENAGNAWIDDLPERWTAPDAVLCIPGVGELDEALAIIVAELVSRRGLGVRAEKAGALSMSRIFGLDMKDTQLICVCYLEDVTAAQVRYALRRLRRKAPSAEIVISVMGETENFEEAEVLSHVSQVHFVRASLEETVDAIIASARDDAEDVRQSRREVARSASSA
jgi:hypothetical protein